MHRLLPLLLIFFSSITVSTAESLVHLSNIYRAPIDMTTMLKLGGVEKFARISNPVAIGAKGNLVYIIDAAKPLVYRYDSSTESLAPLYAVNAHLQGIPNAITVDHDGSFYLSDTFGRKVYHFNMQGELLRTYESPGNLINPVAINLAASGNILIADRLFDHVLVFNRDGLALRAIGSRSSKKGPLLEVIDMVTVPDGIFVLDRLSASVKVFDEAGTLIREIPRPETLNPTAMAVDYAERIYISDAFDDTIKIYNRNGLLETVGGTGSQDGLFRMVTDLHADNNFLYVADSANDRVQVFLLKAAFQGNQDE